MKDVDERSTDEVKKQGRKFLVNKDGFPISQDTMKILWDNVHNLYEDGEKYENEIRGNPDIPSPSIPSVPSLLPTIPMRQKLASIQKYMNELQYNHTGMQFFEVRKYRPLSGLLEIAKEIIRESLPIKCLEAVILSLYLTSGMKDLVRFIISFKSKFSTNVHRHVVLGLNYGSNYGALGLSRRKELMDKPLSFQSLGELILDYKRGYENCHHNLKKVKLSLPVVHDLHSCERISWKYLTLPVYKMTNDEIRMALDKYARMIKNI